MVIPSMSWNRALPPMPSAAPGVKRRPAKIEIVDEVRPTRKMTAPAATNRSSPTRAVAAEAANGDGSPPANWRTCEVEPTAAAGRVGSRNVTLAKTDTASTRVACREAPALVTPSV